MKKILTLAAGALIGLSASLPAEATTITRYKAGTAISEAAQLTTGQYFIYAYSKGAGRFVHKTSDYMADMGLATITEAGITDASYVYDITVNAETGTFTIADNSGETFFPIIGADGQGSYATGNITVANATATGATAAQYALSSTALPTQPADFTDKLFYVQLENGQFVHESETGTAYFHTNGNAGAGHLSYWGGTNDVTTGGSSAILAFYPVTAETADLTAAGKYFLIKNVRKGKYIQAHVDPGALGQIDANTLNATEGRYDASSLWSFVAANQATAVSGYTAVNICNPLMPGQTLASVDPETWSTENTTWYISDTESTNSGHTGFTISKGAAANAQGWNDNGGSTVCYYGNNDGGSKWTFEAADADKVTATLAAIPGVWEAKFNALKAQGNLIAGMAGFPEERATAWTTATGSLTYSEENFETLKTAYGTLVDNLHVKFGSCKENCENDWLSQMNGAPQRWAGGDGSRIFTLKNAGGVGFYVLNEYLQKYIVHPTWYNTSASFSADRNSATVYNIDIFQRNESDHSKTMYGVFSIRTDLAADQKYWHSNGSNELWYWQADRNSSWYVSFADEADAANEDLEGAKNPIVSGYTFGDNVGQYHYTEEFLTTRDGVSATNAAEKRTAAATLRAITPVVLNDVPSGYYRIRNVGSNKLLTSDEITVDINATTNVGSDRLQLISAGNLSNTVWYYDADNKRLVAFANGLCLGKFDKDDKTTCWATVLNSDAKVGDVTFTECGMVGAYSMFTQENNPATYTRRIFGNTSKTVDNVSYTVIDAGGGDAPASRWTLERVTWLPMPYTEGVGYLTIYSPAPLYMSSGSNGGGTQRVNPYTGTISGDKLIKTLIEGTTIPANTPVLLEYVTGIENGHVYVEVAGPVEAATSTVAESEAAFNLIGGIYATAKADGTSYYTVGKPENADASFLPASDEYVPGFVSHLEYTPEAGATAPASFLISDPTPDAITEIEGAGNNGKQVIYDLQGRRVQRASKGLYIINGVKTLVK